MPRLPPLNRLVARIARDEINAILSFRLGIKLRSLSDTVTFARTPDSTRKVTYSLAQLICRRLAQPEAAKRIVGEARKILETGKPW